MDDQTSIVQHHSDGGAEIRMSRSPETVIAEATLCAKALGRMVEKTRSFTVISGRKHLHFTAWATLGTMFRVTARVRDTKFLQFDGVKGFECTAEAFHVPSGQVVSVAEAQCTDDEPNWDMRPSKNGDQKVPLFQLRSMAQTRACAKALRNVLAWVVVLAGYEATPAEEMTGSEQNGHEPPAQATRAPRTSNGDTITEAQVGRLFGLAKGNNKSREALGVILAAHGYSVSADHPDPVDAAARLVKKADFDRVQEAILKP